MTPYTYCFIRKDLPLHYQIIQASHACHEIALTLDDEQKPERTSHLILFEAKDESHLMKIKEKLDVKGFLSHMFHEPDHDTGFTSIATEPIYGDDRKFFRKFKMYKGGQNA